MEEIKKVDCVVLGAGLSGLAAGYELHKLKKSFLVLEKAPVAGGVIGSSKIDGFVIEHGPNSLVLTPEIKALCKELNLENELLYAKPQSKIRQIIWGNKLHTLKPSPHTIVTTSLLSTGGKLRLLKELFIKTTSPAGESVHRFFERRLGTEAAERMAGAIVSGIYAGDPKQLEIAAIFPRLVELEKEYGSVIKGLAKSKGPERTIANFKNGLQTLTDALSVAMKPAIQFESQITSIIKPANSVTWRINYRVHDSSYTIETPQIISTIPAYALEQIAGTNYPSLAIFYNPMLTLQVAVPREEFLAKTMGFGFLASPFERSDFIGVMLNGHIFETGLSDSEALVNFFVRPDDSNSQDPATLFTELCTPLFKEWTGITAPIRLVSSRLWSQAIPQKTVGHLAWLETVKTWENTNLGFHIAGNFKNGVALGDCVAHQQQLVRCIYDD